ncbi:hypothetical protein EDI_158640 [Entamoeba dispar SAW760]|uniref:FF domain-containing protein n=1 Tax=Entamoeba dispar (strain ATCC PRA-260 / SAW760) TaxID=370354 RepID=B0E9S9_ENTDS|nr:uncharacterized protein EDI_158640 [Entamoeba dispar SAW760]EDR28726.1 hypothetical protein EDI_158640 [Entamoeba dispar SAW760]|eukprot:EDR28726.1 hypothetical protein EDI_158640 [Entamoeba dispar SAW760]
MAIPFYGITPGMTLFPGAFQQPLPLNECLKNSVDVRQTLTEYRITIQTQKESWVQCVGYNGKIFYVNCKTKVLTEEKPDIFKTPEELILATCPWKEIEQDGKLVYKNKKTGEIVNEQPEIYKLVIQRIQQLKEKNENKQIKEEGINKKEEMIQMLKDIGVNSQSTWEETKKKMKIIDGMKKKEVRGIFNEYVGALKEEEKFRIEKERKENRKRCEELFSQMMQEGIITIEMGWEDVIKIIKEKKEFLTLSDKDIIEIWKNELVIEEKKGIEKWRKCISENEQLNNEMTNDSFYKQCDLMNIPKYYQEKLYQFYIRDIEQKNEDKKRKQQQDEQLKKQLELKVKDILIEMSDKREILYGDTPDNFLLNVKDIKLDESIKLDLFKKEQSYLKDQYLNVYDDVRDIVNSNFGIITPNMSTTTFIKFYSIFDRRVNRLPRKYLELALIELSSHSSLEPKKHSPPSLDLPLEKKKLI